ncbi:MAG: alpha/beta fold hydrolase [Woeseia sp.]
MTVKYSVLVLLVIVSGAFGKPAPKSIVELANEARTVELREIRRIEGGPGFDARLYQYESAGLKVHTMIAWPDRPMPKRGFPILVFNHGHHPDPPNYGISADGRNWRPGDYYRRIPELYAAEGFAVVIPDYRGHNTSEGLEFTEGLLESAYYTEDVLNLLAGLPAVDGLDADRVFVLGHSMGGDVTLRTLLATGNVTAASLWSSVGGDVWNQAYYYSRYDDPPGPDGSAIETSVIERLRAQLSDLDGEFDTDSIDSYRFLGRLQAPVIIHHAVGDRSAAYEWSKRLAGQLAARGKRYEFWSYDSEDHLFKGCDLSLAVERDVKWFRRFDPPLL